MGRRHMQYTWKYGRGNKHCVCVAWKFAGIQVWTWSPCIGHGSPTEAKYNSWWYLCSVHTKSTTVGDCWVILKMAESVIVELTVATGSVAGDGNKSNAGWWIYIGNNALFCDHARLWLRFEWYHQNDTDTTGRQFWLCPSAWLVVVVGIKVPNWVTTRTCIVIDAIVSRLVARRWSQTTTMIDTRDRTAPEVLGVHYDVNHCPGFLSDCVTSFCIIFESISGNSHT